jgi:hypothetical protein
MLRRARKKAGAVERRLDTWLKKYYTPQMVRRAEALPLRRDMATLLSYVRDQRVTGTQSTGNLPLKAVREVTARFVNPPKLDTVIGDYTRRLRSEADVWALHFLHILAEVGGLVTTGPARRWRLTAQGEQFLGADPLLQVASLLPVWWYRTNWLVAYPFTGMGEALPRSFQQVALTHLRSLPVGTRVAFDTFADRLIRETGLRWTSQDQSMVTMLLRGSIERMIILVLEDFGAVELESRDEPLGSGSIRRLAEFEITPLGQALLEAVAIMGG